MDHAKRKRVIGAAAGVLVAGILIWAWEHAPRTGGEQDAKRVVQQDGPKSGLRQAPELVLKDAKGMTHRLQDMGDSSLVLIHFWAHWCPPCLEEIQKFAEFARKPDASNYRLLAVSEDPTWEEAHKSLPSEGLPKNLISVLDPENKVSELYGTFQYPETYAVRVRDGRAEIVMKWVGPQNWESPEFLAALARLAANQK